MGLVCKEKTDVFQGCQVDGICRGCCRFRGWGLGSKVIQTSTSTFSQAALRTCFRGLQASRGPRLRAPENGPSEGLEGPPGLPARDPEAHYIQKIKGARGGPQGPQANFCPHRYLLFTWFHCLNQTHTSACPCVHSFIPRHTDTH